MAIKLEKEESLFRNELIFAADTKAVNIDHTLVNLFMLLNHNGVRPKQRARSEDKAFRDIDWLKNIFAALEDEGAVEGFKDHPDAVELWLRSNLANMVSRGQVGKEKFSSLRPIHLESYRVRNASTTRDYNTADQVYLMLGEDPTVREELKGFLSEGWDKATGKINNANDLDVDSLGILHLIKNVNPGYLDSSSTLNQIKPLLQDQAKLYCEDIQRLLVYKRLIPRSVLIDYLKTITSFHLSLYNQKLIFGLPMMIRDGSTDIKLDWKVVVDVTDDFDSKVAGLAAADAELLLNSIYAYIKATYQVNAALRYLRLDKSNSKNLTQALEILKEKPTKFELYFEVLWNNTLYPSLDDEDKLLIEDLVRYEETDFDKYIELIMKVRSNYLYRYNVQLLDNLSQKNSDRGFLAAGRSNKHPRRFVLGTRLLETLVQILVLDVKDNKFVTRSLSIEELIGAIKDRHGLIINGLGGPEYQNADLNTHLAFKENVQAFKQKLRQIGFYNDLSDAYILQKVRPRYEINA